MTILVRLDNNNIQSYGIIELQGDLESRNGESLMSKFIGDLHFSSSSIGVPILIVGHHILYGKTVDIEKPLAILAKSATDGETEYVVKGVVKKKIIFKIRPKPIIANTVV